MKRIARDALIGAQLEFWTTWFYEGQVHLPASLLTAIGTVIDTTFLASRAGADQILVTREVNQCAQPEFSGSEAKVYQLKGFP